MNEMPSEGVHGHQSRVVSFFSPPQSKMPPRWTNASSLKPASFRASSTPTDKIDRPGFLTPPRESRNL